VEEHAAAEDPLLPLAPDRREEDLALVAKDGFGRERQRRISSTASTWTPFSRR
jgi:hypothetical protein